MVEWRRILRSVPAFRNYWFLISADTEVSVFLAIVAGALIPSILGFNIKSLNPYKSPGAAPG